MRKEVVKGGYLTNPKKDGERDGDEADVDDYSVGLGQTSDRQCGFFRAETEGLENRGNSVAEVGAEERHRDDVEDGDKPVTEASNNHTVGVVAAELILVGGEVATDFDCVVQKVKNDEGQDGESGPDHDARGLGGLDGGLVGVFGASGFVFLRKNRKPDVSYEADQEANAGDPNSGSMKK